MNRRCAAAALLLLRRQKLKNNHMYWVHLINQWWHEYQKFNTLYKDLRNTPDKFNTYYQMNTEQFDYILSQIEHLIYKLRTNFCTTVCPEEKLAIGIRYVNKILYLKIDNIVMVLSSFATASMTFQRKDLSFKMIKMKNRWQQAIPGWAGWKHCLKLKKMHAFWLAGLTKTVSKSFLPIYIVLLCRYLAMGDAITTIKYKFWIGMSTAWEIILDVCTSIWKVLSPIHIPEDEWRRIAAEFEEQWTFLNCIGAIDGKHVMIQCLFNSGSLFYNYKSFFSIVLLAVTSADYRFAMVDIGAYGSSNDTGGCI